MRTAQAVLLLLSAALGSLRAQPRFDVASVRRNTTDGCRGRWDFRVSHGTVVAENAPLLRIVSRAYRLTDDRVSGPSWLDSECYDIRAKASSPDAPARDVMTMLQELLKDRFHLEAHEDEATRPAFALLQDKDGVKMPRDGAKISVPPSTNPARILFMAKTLDDLCERLGKVTGRPVVDRTGLTGKYVIVLSYSTETDPSDPSANIFTAARDQLGLRLESRKEPVKILSIDKIDKVPTGN